MPNKNYEYLKSLPFGERLQYLRFVNDQMSQSDVASKILLPRGKDKILQPISQPTYNRLEKEGHIRGVPVEIIEQLSIIFDVPKDVLLDGTSEDPLAHLPQHLKQFVLDKDNLDILEDAYILSEYKKRNH
jgi:hypothetical protein